MFSARCRNCPIVRLLEMQTNQTQNADGTINTTNADGTITTTNADGTPTLAPADQRLAAIARKLARNAPNADMEMFYTALADLSDRQIDVNRGGRASQGAIHDPVGSGLAPDPRDRVGSGTIPPSSTTRDPITGTPRTTK